MDKQYGEFVGVDSIYSAIIIEDSEAQYIAETPEYLAPAAEIAGEAETNNTPTYYDNLPANNYVTEGATTLTMTISGIPADKAAKYLGKKYDAATGRVYDSGEPNPPDVAVAFRYKKGKSDYRYYQYLKGNFSGGTEEAATKTNNVDIKTYQLTFTAVSTTHRWSIDSELKPLKRIFADTTDPAFNPNGWFSQVQTPDTVNAPIELSFTSIPADGAINVGMDSNLVLNFSNSILNHSVSLFTTDFTPVEIATSLDATRKVLTITPSEVFAEATNYVLIITQVKDIHGQIIKDNTIEFTTA